MFSFFQFFFIVTFHLYEFLMTENSLQFRLPRGWAGDKAECIWGIQCLGGYHDQMPVSSASCTKKVFFFIFIFFYFYFLWKKKESFKNLLLVVTYDMQKAAPAQYCVLYKITNFSSCDQYKYWSNHKNSSAKVKLRLLFWKQKELILQIYSHMRWENDSCRELIAKVKWKVSPAQTFYCE